MNIGDYVRFKDKRGNTYIRKVIDGYREHWYGCKIDKNANNVPYVSQKNIIKSSPNIIDLIEVGDYVNGERVFGFGKFIYDDDTEEICSLTLETTISCLPEDIKSIVTHEQFESMEYKL